MRNRKIGKIKYMQRKLYLQLALAVLTTGRRSSEVLNDKH